MRSTLVRVCVSLDPGQLAAVDLYAEKLRVEANGIPINRSDAVRRLIAVGLQSTTQPIEQ